MKVNKLLSMLLVLAMTVGMMATLVTTAFAGAVTEDFLDLETSTDYADVKTFDQKCNLSVVSGKYTDVTKVKVEWNVTDISAIRKDAKKWNPDTLNWVDDDGEDAIEVIDGTATFTVTNLSSVSVEAEATFTQVSPFTAPTVTFNEDGHTEGTDDGKIVVGTVVGKSHVVSTNVAPSAVIGVTVKPVASDFATASAMSSVTYGTYTLTLRHVQRILPATVNISSHQSEMTLTVNDDTTHATTFAYAGGSTVGSVNLKAGDKITVTMNNGARPISIYAYTGDTVPNTMEEEGVTLVATGGQYQNVQTLSYTLPSDETVTGYVICIIPEMN